MKLIISTIFILFVFTNKINAQNDTCDQCCCFKNETSFWKHEEAKTGKQFLIRGSNIKLYADNIRKMINNINSSYSIKLKLIRIKNGIPYIKIVNSNYLQKMGLHSSTAYLAVLVFNLTEVKGINKVYLDYEEGEDLNSPGFFTRNYFKQYYTICYSSI